MHVPALQACLSNYGEMDLSPANTLLQFCEKKQFHVCYEHTTVLLLKRSSILACRILWHLDPDHTHSPAIYALLFGQSQLIFIVVLCIHSTSQGNPASRYNIPSYCETYFSPHQSGILPGCASGMSYKGCCGTGSQATSETQMISTDSNEGTSQGNEQAYCSYARDASAPHERAVIRPSQSDFEIRVSRGFLTPGWSGWDNKVVGF